MDSETQQALRERLSARIRRCCDVTMPCKECQLDAEVIRALISPEPAAGQAQEPRPCLDTTTAVSRSGHEARNSGASAVIDSSSRAGASVLSAEHGTDSGAKNRIAAEPQPVPAWEAISIGVEVARSARHKVEADRDAQVRAAFFAAWPGGLGDPEPYFQKWLASLAPVGGTDK